MKKGLLWMFLFVSLAGIAFARPSSYCGGGYGDCSCGDTVVGNAYLYEDLNCVSGYGDGLTIGANDIELNCNDYLIDGYGNPSNVNGIYINGYADVGIYNCYITGFQTGILAVDTDTLDITNGDIFDNSGTNSGIHLANAHDTRLWYVEIDNNNIGLDIDGSLETLVYDSNIHDNTNYGIYSEGSAGLTVLYSEFEDTGVGIYVDGYGNHVGGYGDNINENNFYDNTIGVHLDEDHYAFVGNNYFEDNSDKAIYVQDSNDAYLGSNNIYGGNTGIYFDSSGYGDIVYNDVYDFGNYGSGTGYGIRLEGARSENNLYGNEIYPSAYGDVYGIYVSDDSNYLIDNYVDCPNTFSGTSYGIFVDNNDNTLQDNHVEGCNYGLIAIDSSGLSSDEETYSNNEYGIFLSGLTDSTINEPELDSNCDGLTIEGSSDVDVIDPTIHDNAGCPSGMHVNGYGNVIDLIDGDFQYNGFYGINSRYGGDVQWTLLNDVICTNNDIYIASGWLVPLGGKLIPTNCDVWINGKQLDFDNGEIGYMEMQLDILGYEGTLGGLDDYGIEAEVHYKQDTFSAPVRITFYDEKPAGVATYKTPFGKWVEIDASSFTEIDYIILKVGYTDEELADSGISESRLRLSYYNETSGEWEMFDSPRGGVNDTENYVWANITHFSIFGIFKGGSSGGGGGGGSGAITVTWPDDRDGLKLSSASAGSIVYFNVMPFDPNTGYVFTISSVSQLGVSFEVASLFGTLLPGQKVDVNVNGDSANDISISVLGVNGDTADILLERIGVMPVAVLPEIPVVTAPKEELKAPATPSVPPKEELKAPVSEEKKAGAEKTKWLPFIAGLAALLILIAIALRLVMKKKHY